MDGGSGTPEAPQTVVGGGAAGTPVASRWNPTKEQINMLEDLYKQGLRTPTADQIQEITNRLQTYGHIEGKNVFYWFQNHKARQRQKEKQDHLSLFRQYNHHHRLLQPPPFVHLSPPPNVIYIPQNNIGFYVPQPQVLSPNTTPSSPLNRRSPRSANPISADAAGLMLMPHPENVIVVSGQSNIMNSEQDDIVTSKNNTSQETLDLFPMHPTGILQETVDTTGNGGCIASRACTSSLSGGAVDRVYFDFFC